MTAHAHLSLALYLRMICILQVFGWLQMMGHRSSALSLLQVRGILHCRYQLLVA